MYEVNHNYLIGSTWQLSIESKGNSKGDFFLTFFFIVR